MGYVTCGACGRRSCYRCDGCPACDGVGRLLRGDYCRACTEAIRAAGGVWSDYCKDYVKPKPEDLAGGVPGQVRLLEEASTVLEAGPGGAQVGLFGGVPS